MKHIFFSVLQVYDLIYELNHICPSILLSVIPQLEYKLKSTDDSERLGSVSLLARMFSEKDSTLAIHHTPLWQAFIGRLAQIISILWNQLKVNRFNKHGVFGTLLGLTT
jgi:hypothetical protein